MIFIGDDIYVWQYKTVRIIKSIVSNTKIEW